MTYIEFINLVAAMRAAQRLYFRDRTQTNLQMARDLEKRVDDALLRMASDQDQTKPRQADLFPPEPKP